MLPRNPHQAADGKPGILPAQMDGTCAVCLDGALEKAENSSQSEGVCSLQIFDRVQGMLGLAEQEAATLVGISPSALLEWRIGTHPRSAATRRLYELATVLDLVATRHGDMAAWAKRMSPGGQPWLALAGEPNGPARVLSYLREELLTPKAPTRLEVGSDDEDSGGEGAGAGPGSVGARRAGPRRRAR